MMKVFFGIIAPLFFSAALLIAGTYSGGDGLTEETAFQIADANDMQEIGANEGDWDKFFILTADVNLAEFTGDSFNIIGNSTTYFTGIFDGNNYTIDNFTYTSTNMDYIGVFGYLGFGGQVRNLGLTNTNINAGTGSYVGSLTGFTAGKVDNCYSVGSVASTGNYIGGLVGFVSRSFLLNSHSIGVVSGNDHVGGLLGENYRSSVSNCYSNGSVNGNNYVGGLIGRNRERVPSRIDHNVNSSYSTCSVDGNSGVGGLIGYIYDGGAKYCSSSGPVVGNMYVGGLVGRSAGYLDKCYSSGSVENTGRYAGGLTGRSGTEITQCFSTGSVVGDTMVGGLSGYNPGDITNCYSTSDVSGNTEVGGVAGYVSYGGSISKCYSAGSVYGNSNVGGVVGNDYYGSTVSYCYFLYSDEYDNELGIPLSNQSMKMQSSFIGWDFSLAWKMLREGKDYPRLKWQTEYAGDIAGLYGVDLEDLALLSSIWSNHPDNIDLLMDLSENWLAGK